MACLGVMVPSAVRAEALRATTPNDAPRSVQATPATTAVHDVALGAGGTLTGRVVDADGNAAIRVPVTIHHQGVQVAQCVTDENGAFVTENLHGGVHDVVTPNGVGTYRLWTQNVAPPVAQPQMQVVNAPVYRGQMHHGRALGFLTNPWVLGVGVAAAIAIPIALSDDDDNAS